MVTVRIEGTLDVKRAPRRRRQLRANLDCSRNMRNDLSDVSLIDGSGLASLVELFHAARRQGKACSLVGASDAVMRVLEMNRLDRVFAFTQQKERHPS